MSGPWHKRSLRRGKSAVRIRFSEIPDCREAAAKVRIEGAVLDSGEVLALISLLEAGGRNSISAE